MSSELRLPAAVATSPKVVQSCPEPGGSGELAGPVGALAIPAGVAREALRSS
jgi:hypothetical protein